jgi:hypothetical protein
MSSQQNTIKVAEALGRRGYAVTSMNVRTPDGRAWAIDTTSTGSLRLFEIDREGKREPEEHDANDGEWTAGDLIDYLAAVGQPKST